MFCLRSWIPILFFLKNASPIYLILFVSATYFLNRPCVYCSLLLAILVVSLFDFQSSWFEPASAHQAVTQATATSILPDYIVSAVSAATDNAIVTVVDETVGKLVSHVSGVEGTFVEWMKGVLRKEWRVQCLDLVIRL